MAEEAQPVHGRPAPAIPGTKHLAEREALLARRLTEAKRRSLPIHWKTCNSQGGRLRISPLRAITPDEAEGALAPLYAHLPSIWITDLLADVDRWTSLTGCFTYLTTGRAHDGSRAILTAVSPMPPISTTPA